SPWKHRIANSALRRGSTASDVSATVTVRKVVLKKALTLREKVLSIPNNVFNAKGAPASAAKMSSHTKKVKTQTMKVAKCACRGQSFACTMERETGASLPSPSTTALQKKALTHTSGKVA